jgi:hypothetical protein
MHKTAIKTPMFIDNNEDRCSFVCVCSAVCVMTDSPVCIYSTFLPLNLDGLSLISASIPRTDFIVYTGSNVIPVSHAIWTTCSAQP